VRSSTGRASTPALTQHGERPPGRDHLDPQLREPGRELRRRPSCRRRRSAPRRTGIDSPAGSGAIFGGGKSTLPRVYSGSIWTRRGVLLVDPQRGRPRASGSSQAAAHARSRGSPPRSRPNRGLERSGRAAGGMIGPESTPLVDEVNRDAGDLGAVIDRLLQGVDAREGGQAAPGARLITRFPESAATNSG